jgi:hypothetical protein
VGILMQSDLKEFVELLIASEVEFVVVGAHAVAFPGPLEPGKCREIGAAH